MRALAFALLAILRVASAHAEPAPRALDIRLFHAGASAIEAAGVPLAELIAANDPRSWSVRVLKDDDWRALVARLDEAESVHEVEIPGAKDGILVTRERPWQLDGSVELAVSEPGEEGSAVSIVELPLRVACWIAGSKDEAPVSVEALIPTGHSKAGGAVPLATRVELEVGAKPVIAVAVTCEDGACDANVLAIGRRGD